LLRTYTADGIVADQDHRQAGTALALRLAFGHLVVDHGENGVGHGLAVENACAHRETLKQKGDFPGNPPSYSSEN
jgi:hypothetical protein